MRFQYILKCAASLRAFYPCEECTSKVIREVKPLTWPMGKPRPEFLARIQAAILKHRVIQFPWADEAEGFPRPEVMIEQDIGGPFDPESGKIFMQRMEHAWTKDEKIDFFT